MIEVSMDNVHHSDKKPYSSYVTKGTSMQQRKRYKEQYGFKIGRFTKSDNKIIQDNWAKLMALNSVTEPKVLLEQLKDKQLSKDPSEIQSRNVIGMYLGQGL